MKTCIGFSVFSSNADSSLNARLMRRIHIHLLWKTRSKWTAATPQRNGHVSAPPHHNCSRGLTLVLKKSLSSSAVEQRNPLSFLLLLVELDSNAVGVALWRKIKNENSPSSTIVLILRCVPGALRWKTSVPTPVLLNLLAALQTSATDPLRGLSLASKVLGKVYLRSGWTDRGEVCNEETSSGLHRTVQEGAAYLFTR